MRVTHEWLVAESPAATHLRAGRQIGTDLVAKAPADGHTLLLATTAPNSTAPSLYSKLAYDPLKDFAPVSLIAFTFYVLSVNPAVPVKTIPELVKLAKARPGELNFSSPGNGTPNHLSGEMLKTMAGIRMQHIPFKGPVDALAEVMAERAGRPLLIVDIAVPRDVDPTAAQLDGVTLLDMDDLKAFADAGVRERRREVAGVRSIIDDETEHYFGLHAQAEQRDQVGILDGARSRFGRQYIGTPDRLAEELSRDAAVLAADTLLVTVPNQLGVDFNARILASLARDVMPAVRAAVPSLA